MNHQLSLSFVITLAQPSACQNQDLLAEKVELAGPRPHHHLVTAPHGAHAVQLAVVHLQDNAIKTNIYFRPEWWAFRVVCGSIFRHKISHGGRPAS